MIIISIQCMFSKWEYERNFPGVKFMIMYTNLYTIFRKHLFLISN
jgi:hypothetical protein